LRREVAESGGNAEEKGIVGSENVVGHDGIRRFRGCIHFGKHFVGEGFGDSVGGNIVMRGKKMDGTKGQVLVNSDRTPSTLDASLDGFCD